MSSRSYNREQLLLVQNMLGQNASISEIVKASGLGQQTIYRIKRTDPVAAEAALDSQGLGKIIRDLAMQEGRSLNEMTVLSEMVDPFRLDTPANHRDGRWLADHSQGLGLTERVLHIRGLHYALVAHGGIWRPDGALYVNDEDSWTWLKCNPRLSVTFYDACLPDDDDIAPVVSVGGFTAKQKYRLVFWGEKTSLDDVLDPLARELEADLYLPSGEISDSMLHQMARIGANDGREMIVLVFADCDPAGYQMVVSIAHKLRAFKESLYPRLRFQVLAPALTVEQVRQFGLPSTPLKESELRKDGWRDKYGVEQTEIDALATLRPDLLGQIARKAAAPFFDRSLRRRAAAAANAWERDAVDQLNQGVDDNAEYQALYGEVIDAIEELRPKMERLREIVEDDIEIDVPAPAPVEANIIESDLPAPLVSSEMPLIEAIDILRDRKDYTNGKAETA